MKTTCIMCPVGCRLEITKSDKEIMVTGNGCIRGKEYGKQEFVNPARIVTALLNTDKGVLPVKTTGLVPKSKIVDVLAAIGKIKVKSAKSGDIIVKNILQLGVDVLVTGDYPFEIKK